MTRYRKFKRPTLGPIEKRINARFSLAKYRAGLKEKGYRFLQKAVPDAFRQEILDFIDKKIEEYEESRNLGEK